MTDPQRLLDGAGDEIEVALLRSAKPDAPSTRAMRRTLAALGIAGAATAAGLATASTAPPAAGGAAMAFTKSSGLVLVKWLGVATIGGLALWGATGSWSAEDPALVQRAIAKETRALSNEARAIGERPLVRAPRFDRDRLARTPQEATPRRTPSRASTEQRGGDLSAEVAALDDARRRLDQDPKAALAAMDAYDDKFKKDGALGPEAELLRIEALARAGEHERARALGNAFLARHPASPLVQRVRSLLARLNDE